MSFEMMVALSYSVAPAAIAVAVRFSKIPKAYYPIAICLLLALSNETISTFLLLQGYSNAINNNVYSFAEAVLILIQFRYWGLFGKQKTLFIFILLVSGVLWIMENRNMEHSRNYLPFFRAVAGIIIVTMGIITINKLVASYEGSLWRCPAFLFSWGFNLYFGIVIILEIFLSYSNAANNALPDAVFKASTVINVVANILYLFAVLWIPRKPRFIMQ